MSKAKTINAKNPKKSTAGNADDELLMGVNSVAGNHLDSDTDTIADKEPVTHSKETHEAMKPYVKAYPDADHFLIASDGQVFLHTHLIDAKTHQKNIDAKKELVKYSK